MTPNFLTLKNDMHIKVCLIFLSSILSFPFVHLNAQTYINLPSDLAGNMGASTFSGIPSPYYSTSNNIKYQIIYSRATGKITKHIHFPELADGVYFLQVSGKWGSQTKTMLRN